jgi:hypothetical protein
MERPGSLQHSQGRMERTKNTGKNPLKIVSFGFCGKVIDKPKQTALVGVKNG